jgi:hypothetical protein
MTARLDRMREDRHIRDAARALVEADIANLRADLSAKGLGERAMDRFTEGASEVYEEAVEVAADHKGALAAIVAALVLWFARHPILDAFFGETDGSEQA